MYSLGRGSSCAMSSPVFRMPHDFSPPRWCTFANFSRQEDRIKPDIRTTGMNSNGISPLVECRENLEQEPERETLVKVTWYSQRDHRLMIRVRVHACQRVSLSCFLPLSHSLAKFWEGIWICIQHLERTRLKVTRAIVRPTNSSPRMRINTANIEVYRRI